MRKIRSGDEVIVISGRNRGQTGKVRQVIQETDRVVDRRREHRHQAPSAGAGPARPDGLKWKHRSMCQT